jgi:hypothetical protein
VIVQKIQMYYFTCFFATIFVPFLHVSNASHGIASTDIFGPLGQPDVASQGISWTGANYQFPCSTTKALLKSSGKFISKNNIATRGQIYRDTIFLALPRYKKGVPATLVKTKLKRGACSVEFEPFPCWNM